VSEKLFEQFCAKNEIRFENIETGESRTPDYNIFPSSNLAVVEVKQIDLTIRIYKLRKI
jgi:hypothetical protein